MIEVKVILDSVSPQGHRLTTFQLRYPKFIHGELMTHRVFSRNASSSRAVPVSKNLEEVRSDDLRAAPVWWGAEQKGMASGEELSDEYLGPKHQVQMVWQLAAHRAADSAESLAAYGVHKSIVNRVLEPFLHINVLVSATEYANFFGLRLDRAAQPEMRVLAEKMWAAYNESKPRLIHPDASSVEYNADIWHLPFIDDDVRTYIRAYCAGQQDAIDESGRSDDPIVEANECAHLIRVSVARCARVSYTSFETGRRSTLEEDLRLYDRLMGAQPLHASPAEHQATPDQWKVTGYTPQSDRGGCYGHGERTGGHSIHGWAYPGQHGNFTGWRQYRKMLPGEAVAPLPAAYRSQN